MRIRRLLSCLLLAAALFSFFTVPATAASSLTVSFDSDKTAGETVAAGKTVTYTLTITKNSGGFSMGTFFFRPSESLVYQSATRLGADYVAEPAVTGENQGAYGILITEPCTQSGIVYCTITFLVQKACVPSVDFYAYQLISGDATGATESVALTIVGNAVSQTLTPLDGSGYRIADGYLHGVVALTTRAALIERFEQKEKIKVFAADGAEITDDSALIGTGCTVSLMSGGKAVDSATVVVLGDTSGDGRIGTADYTYVKAYYLKKYDLKGAYLLAAHVAGNSTVGTADYTFLKAHYLGKYNIYAT